MNAATEKTVRFGAHSAFLRRFLLCLLAGLLCLGISACAAEEPAPADPDLPESYRAFLNGEALLERASVLPLQKGREPYTLEELQNGWAEQAAAQQYGALEQKGYALIECKGEKQPLLGLRFTFEKGSNAEPFVIQILLKETDGVLQEVTHLGGENEINPYGFYRNAAAYTEQEEWASYGVIETTLGAYGGKTSGVYEEVRLAGLAQPCIPHSYLMTEPPADYPALEELLQEDGPFVMRAYCLYDPAEEGYNSEFLYTFFGVKDGKEQAVSPAEEWQAWYAENGVTVCSRQDAKDRIDDLYRSLGISPVHRGDPAVEWIPYS